METTYIISFIVDGREWSSRPIKGSLQEATDEAKDQLRISRFYGKKPVTPKVTQSPHHTADSPLEFRIVAQSRSSLV